jgi:hypothetical protein
MADVLWRIAAASHTRIGFEPAERTNLPQPLTETPSLGDWTLSQTLDAAMTMDGRYEWRKVGDMVVVRPKLAWNDADDPLNRPVRDVQVTDWPKIDVIDALVSFIYTNRFVPSHKFAVPGDVSFRVDSGTVIDVLNHLTVAADQMMWVAFASPKPQAEGGWHVNIDVRNAKHLTSGAWSPRPQTAAKR